MHSRLRMQESVGIRSANLENRSLDSCFFAFALVENAHLEAAPLCPACVHPHQHLRPILCLGATGAGTDLDLRISEIIRTTKQRLELERSHLIAKLRGFGVELALHLRLGAVLQHLVELECARDAPAQFVVGVDPAAQRFYFLQRRLRFLLVVPEARFRHLGVERAQASALAVDVKDTSATPRVGRYSASDLDCVHSPPFYGPSARLNP